MSLKEWKKKYYPVDAEDMCHLDDISVTEAALLKWSGLTKDALSKYNLWLNSCNGFGPSIADNGEVFVIDADTCSLCHKYCDCDICPIHLVSGEDCTKEYGIFGQDGDPFPMIILLSKTLTCLRKKEKIGEIA